MGKLPQVEDIAAAVLFLASSRARIITGDSLRVDGGWTGAMTSPQPGPAPNQTAPPKAGADPGSVPRQTPPLL